MKHVKILIAIMIICCFTEVRAQKAYKNSNGLFIIESTGLPASFIKSMSEVENSKEQPSGIVKRHTVLSGNGANPNVNTKVSPKFAIANHDVLTLNNQTGEYQDKAHWMEASGWEDISADNNLNESGDAVLRGCAAYRGPDGTDSRGSWRLPTARELTLVWSLMSKLEALGFSLNPNYGYYWSSSESTAAKAYVLVHPGGSLIDPDKWNKGRLRCVRDL